MVKWESCTCEQVWKEVSNYLEGEVDPGLRAAMDDHFQTCQRCRSVLEGMRNIVQLYGDERMIEVPSGFGRRLEKRLAQNARTREQRMVHVVGVAGSGGGPGTDRRRSSNREFADGAASHVVGTRATGPQYSS